MTLARTSILPFTHSLVSRPVSRLVFPLALALGFGLSLGCTDFDTSSLEGDEGDIESVTQTVRGGDVVTGDGFPGVARLQIERPDDDMGDPREPLDCSGVLVAPTLVLTSALCVFRNIETGTLAGTITVGFGRDGTEPAGGIAGTDVELHRYFAEASAGIAQLAFVHLAAEAPVGATPVAINDVSLDNYNSPITIVGYGESADGSGIGEREGITIAIGAVTEEFFEAGTANETTCNGDGGSPVFGDLGNGPVLIGITQFQSTCQIDHDRTRVDAHAADFIIPYVDQFSGPCLVDGTCETAGCRTPDPDCPENACEWGNACEADCPTRDWDCDLGSFVGDECAISGECEEEGACVAAADDAAFLYCNRPCDSSASGIQCPTNMTCENDTCTYGVPSPGSQGFTCNQNEQCRSGICEDTICVNECNPAASDCPAEFTCGPSKVQPGTNVCLGEDLSGGGGGFCTAAGGSGSGALALLVFALGLIGLRGRRRRK